MGAYTEWGSVVITLPPWANGPFELMIHAESYLRRGDDFDRRISLISFDNAIEVAITTYLTLHPIQRGGRTYASNNVEQWMRNYHSKLEFFEEEIKSRNVKWQVEKAHIIWAHDCRNEQYHGGQKGIPEKNVLDVARSAALWIFSVLFDVSDTEATLEQALLEQAPRKPPSRDRKLDTAIDAQYGIVSVGDEDYYASELLFSVDYAAYRALGVDLADNSMDELNGEAES